MVTLGKFFFRTRNWLFPLLAVAIYLLQPPPPTGVLRDGVALVLMALGVGLRVLTISLQRVSRDGRGKAAHAQELFTGGMFGVCRNPLYLGNLTAVTGFFLLHGDPLVAFLGIGLFVFIYYCIIFSEEAYLSAKFGDEWQAYKADVPRLMPRLDRFGAIFRQGQFNLRKALRSESNVISLNTLLAAFALWYKDATIHGTALPPLSSVVLFALLAAYFIVISRWK